MELLAANIQTCANMNIVGPLMDQDELLTSLTEQCKFYFI